MWPRLVADESDGLLPNSLKHAQTLSPGPELPWATEYRSEPHAGNSATVESLNQEVDGQG